MIDALRGAALSITSISIKCFQSQGEGADPVPGCFFSFIFVKLFGFFGV
jgi:hypothetical protein